MAQTQQISKDFIHIHTIKILLESIFKREATSVQMIVSHLYQIGSQDFIDHQVMIPALQPLVKSVACASTPFVKTAGSLWFQANGPRLIAEWLYSQVQSKRSPAVDVQAVDMMTLPDEVQKQLLYSQLNVKKLRSALKLRTQIFVGIVITLMVGLIFEYFH